MALPDLASSIASIAEEAEKIGSVGFDGIDPTKLPIGMGVYHKAGGGVIVNEVAGSVDARIITLAYDPQGTYLDQQKPRIRIGFSQGFEKTATDTETLLVDLSGNYVKILEGEPDVITQKEVYLLAEFLTKASIATS